MAGEREENAKQRVTPAALGLGLRAAREERRAGVRAVGAALSHVDRYETLVTRLAERALDEEDSWRRLSAVFSAAPR
ncbi:hypothetical protein [Amycolatopsis sp. NPDC059021]|uniref:hypothetical protein n=1 Tax=Amycolatopsis sp. NPDC059021 TaxID=3346704 RepID=UPI00366DC24E